jgi:predicted DsbA family dithiol-disulfide isomerase
MNDSLVIDYYSDILCVWAWIAQRRIDELNTQLGDKIEIHHHYLDIFGDVAQKIESQWARRGSYQGFSDHVQKSAARYDDALVNSKVWTGVRPATSANAHLFLKAVEISYGQQRGIDMALVLRNSFFRDAQDIGRFDVLDRLLAVQGVQQDVVHAAVQDGTAMAALMSDYQSAKQRNIKGSPSYVMDSDRQILYGNVGYRVIHANVEELLKHPEDEASWC